MRTLLLVLALPLVGCISGDPDTGASVQAVTTHNALTYNRLAGNRLAGNRLAGNRLAGNRLAGNRLAGNRLTLNPQTDDLIETADGRDVLTYLIGCALPEGTTLVGTDSAGNTYEFNGELGLAPHWLDHRLNAPEKGWVSACMFSRVNANDVAVSISLRGQNKALAVSPDEAAGWTAEEGAFYGDLFVPLDQPIAWYACRGRDSAEAYADERDCAIPDPAHPGYTLCNFFYAGECGGQAWPPTPHACKHDNHGYYTDCATYARFGGGLGRPDRQPDRDDVNHQVITVFVQ